MSTSTVDTKRSHQQSSAVSNVSQKRGKAMYSVPVLKPRVQNIGRLDERYLIWSGDVEKVLDLLPMEPMFDLVVTSPPYNIGKAYEKRVELPEYLKWHTSIIEKIVPRLKPTGSLCWQVGRLCNSVSVNSPS